MEEYIYKMAEECHIESLVNLRIRLNCYEEEIQDEEQLREEIRRVLKEQLNKTIFFFIVLDKNKIIACAAIIIQTLIPYSTIPNGKNGFITNVFTEEEYRRKGVQRELIKMAIECAKEHECRRIELNAASPNAIKLYESFGFERMDNKFKLELN